VKSVLNDFKAFILRGNVVDLAVGVAIGAAFTTVVTSFTKNLLTPILAIPGDKASFSALDFSIRNATFRYGAFIDDIIGFVLIAAALFFFVVRPVNTLMARRKTEPDVESTTKECDFCLSNVPVGAIVCAFCTRDIDRAAMP
jgi:large conductance mechanosensitive channel